MDEPNQSGLAGKAFVAIWHDIAPEGLREFYEWHHREHMPERLAIPGFRRGRRYRREDGTGQDYFNLYEVDNFDVLVGPDYLARLNAPTEWTRRTVAHFRNVTRGLCRVAGSAGLGQGGTMATLRFSAAADRETALREHLVRTAIPLLMQQVGVLGAHLGGTDPAGSRLETAEKRARDNPTDIPAWVVLVEGISGPHIRQALNRVLPNERFQDEGASGPPLMGLYRLEATRLKSPASAG